MTRIQSLFGRLRVIDKGGIEKQRVQELLALCRSLGVRISNLTLLNQALMHRSYVYEMEMGRAQSNERMEFLGDAILGLVVNEHLYATYANRQEGRLTKIKSLLVSETVLSRRAEELAFGRYILLSENERLSGGAERSSILADAFEAVIAAIYLDSGLDAARRFVEKYILAGMDELLEVDEYRNYKSMIQEHAQKAMGSRPRYRVVSSTGPEHKRTFYVELRLGGRALGRGEGLNKKVAEQMAARNALIKLKLIPDGDDPGRQGASRDRRRRRRPRSSGGRPPAKGVVATSGRTSRVAEAGNRTPRVSEPGNRKPRVAEPGNRKPRVSEPDNRRPRVSQPDSRRPRVSQPDNRKPRVSESDSRKPRAAEPDNRRPRVSQPDNRKPRAAEPDSRKPRSSGTASSSGDRDPLMSARRSEARRRRRRRTPKKETP